MWKVSYKDPLPKELGELLKLNRKQLRWVTAVLTGGYHRKGQIHKLGLTYWYKSHLHKVTEQISNSFTYHMWLWGHSLRKILSLGHYFMEPGDYIHVPLSKVFHLEWKIVGVWGGWTEGDTQ
jgi:hypothetical protein